MTESISATQPLKEPSFWEDLIDIYLQPVAVFRRAERRSVWPPMLFVALSVGLIFFATFNTLQPVFEAEFTRNMAKTTAANPQMTPEMLAKGRDIGLAVTRYGITVVMLVTMFLIGTVTWLLGKMVGARTTFHAALVVAAWAYMPRVLGAVLAGVQGLVLDPSKLTSQLALSIGPARFFDPDTTNPLLYQVLGRFDLITLWVTVLLAIGVYATGNITKTRAVVFGVLIWVIGSLPMLRAGYMAM